MPGPGELLILLAVLLLLFGATKVPQLARSLGASSREFKQGLKEGADVSGPCPFCSTQIPAEAKFCPGCSKSEDEIRAERAKTGV